MNVNYYPAGKIVFLKIQQYEAIKRKQMPNRQEIKTDNIRKEMLGKKCWERKVDMQQFNLKYFNNISSIINRPDLLMIIDGTER